MSLRSRWISKYDTARLWEAVARRRYIWHPTPDNRTALEQRRNEVARARRVLKRHPHDDKPVPAHGFDVSNHNGTVDFRAAKRSGQDFVYIKAGEGVDWKDPDFAANVRAATAARLEVGAYHFLRPKAGRTGAQEAAFFIARLKTAGLGKGDLRPVLDVEATTLDRAGTHAYVRSFVMAMQAAGYKPMIYSADWFWRPNVGPDDFGLPLWVAGYVDERRLVIPKPWTSWAVWQWTDKATVPGIHGHVDANRCPDLRRIIA
jgi:lysozyme